jgi:hypothetical protein
MASGRWASRLLSTVAFARLPSPTTFACRSSTAEIEMLDTKIIGDG